MNHINCNETPPDRRFNAEYLFRPILLAKCDGCTEDYREAATAIYDPELEYSPMLQGYFDLMSISSTSSSGRAINPRRSPLQSRTAFQNFCDGLMDEHDHFILKHKRQRKRNFTAIKNHIEDLLDDGCELLLMLEGVSYPTLPLRIFTSFIKT